MMRLWAAIAAIVLTGCTHIPSPQTQTFFLVRHAEKQAGLDPALTDAGVRRANALADLMKDAHLSGIYSSDYARTRETAAPVAEKAGLDVMLYDPRDLTALSARLASECGRCLVVGHSNTTPALAAALGGEAGDEIDEATEYDRLYIITRDSAGVNTKIERFGN